MKYGDGQNRLKMNIPDNKFGHSKKEFNVQRSDQQK